MRSNFRNIQVEITGESHSEKIGVKIGGIKKGSVISKETVREYLAERKSKNDVWSTPRKEDDEFAFESGVENGTATGEVVSAVIYNKSVRKSDYDEIAYKPRPSHADYAAWVKDGAIPSGGGRFSGRMTAPLCIAGAVAAGILKTRGIEIGAYVSRIGTVKGESFDSREVAFSDTENAKAFPIAVLNRDSVSEMENEIRAARESGDSVGGEIECLVFGLPAGVGDAMFDGLESSIAYSVFAVPAVKGVEFGKGFGFCSMCGSKANDAFRFEDGKVVTETNNNGGINGGISNGMPLTLRVAFKPTPSIAVEQKTVDLKAERNATLKIQGRHDACIVPRAVPCVKAAVALAVLDAVLDNEKS